MMPRPTKMPLAATFCLNPIVAACGCIFVFVFVFFPFISFSLSLICILSIWFFWSLLFLHPIQMFVVYVCTLIKWAVSFWCSLKTNKVQVKNKIRRHVLAFCFKMILYVRWCSGFKFTYNRRDVSALSCWSLSLNEWITHELTKMIIEVFGNVRVRMTTKWIHQMNLGRHQIICWIFVFLFFSYYCFSRTVVCEVSNYLTVSHVKMRFSGLFQPQKC